MKKLSIAFLVAMAVAAVGCKDKSDGVDTLAKMSEFKDRICACKDKPCTDRITAEMTKWTQQTGRTGELQNLSNEDLRRSTAIGGEITRCVTKIAESAAAGAGSSPPPASAPAEGSAAAPQGSDAPAPTGSAR
jgi:hypothetical protein